MPVSLHPRCPDLNPIWFCQDCSCVCCIGKANLYPEIYKISALACFKRVQLIELKFEFSTTVARRLKPSRATPV